jgi:hypothetical protein
MIRVGRLSTIDEISTLIHETLHAACPYMAEEAVVQLEADIVSVLTAAGVRLSKAYPPDTPA